MLTCKQCKELSCLDRGSDRPSCDDFTSKTIEEESVEYQPTPEAYRELKRIYGEACDAITRLEAIVEGYEHAVAELVRFAQEETL